MDQILVLKDKECIDTAIFMLERANILLELSASICVAALIYNKFIFKKKDNIVMILCGGNLDLHKLATIISPHHQNNPVLK